MSDDTTTWLKKNPAINPLRRSLKTSLRFNVPNSDMNSSIMSNPDKVKDQGLFIPRMLQRSNMQMRKSRIHEFKVPELVVSKPAVKKESSGVKVKKVPTPSRARKSFLPVAKVKTQPSEKTTTKTNLPRPSYIPGTSTRTAKRDLIKMVVELSEIKRKEEAESQVKIPSGDSSVLRSILKKRASLRRSSQISAKKTKAKKVLFNGFENSDGEKENEMESLQNQNDFIAALDEPTVFLNFPNGGTSNVDESLFESTHESLNRSVGDIKLSQNDITNILKLWDSYKENLENIQTERNSVEESFESLLQHSLTFQKEYQAYKESSEEMYTRLSKLGKEIEENLQKIMSHRVEVTPKSKKPSGKKGSDKCEKIKMSDRSKAIKKNSGRKSVPFMKKAFLTDMEDSFSIVSKTNF